MRPSYWLRIIERFHHGESERGRKEKEWNKTCVFSITNKAKKPAGRMDTVGPGDMSTRFILSASKSSQKSNVSLLDGTARGV
jgi:hypothetical protein